MQTQIWREMNLSVEYERSDDEESNDESDN